jgi:MFS family permease
MPLLSAPRGLGVLRNRNLSFYLTSRFLGTLAVQMQSVAIGWQVYQITGSLFDLGLIGLAQFAPFLVLILWAGHVADRYDRRKIIVLCMLTQLLVSGLLLAFTVSASRIVWPVFAVLVLFGSARASSTSHVAVIAGPVLGGLLYVFGPLVVYLSRSTCSRCCSAAPPPSFRRMRTTCCPPARARPAGCAPRPARGRRCARSC